MRLLGSIEVPLQTMQTMKGRFGKSPP